MREVTSVRGHVIGITRFRAFGPLEFVGAGEPTPTASFALLFWVTGLLPFFLGAHRVRLGDLGTGRAAALFFELGDALVRRLQLPLQGPDEFDHAFNADASFAQVSLEL